MSTLLRVVAILAGLSVASTVWFIVGFAIGGGLSVLPAAGPVGALTVLGWLVTLIVGPFAATRLWDYQEKGRRAGLVLFGCGLAYDVMGLFAFRTPGGRVPQTVLTGALYAFALVILLSRRARQICR